MDDPAGDAWARWLALLGTLSDRLSGPEFPTDDRGRAEGIRHLARQAQLALQGELEHADARHPRLHRYELPWSQWGAPNPDNVYERCAIDPTRDLRAARGRSAACTRRCSPSSRATCTSTRTGVFAEVALSDLDVGPDGSLELHDRPRSRGGAGNHLRTDGRAPACCSSASTSTTGDEPVATFTIERVDPAGRRRLLRRRRSDRRGARSRARGGSSARSSYWAELRAASRDLLEHNTFTAPNTPPGGAPSIAYGGGCWELAPGRGPAHRARPSRRALLELVDPPAALVRLRAHGTSGSMSCNGHQAHVDADGRVRARDRPCRSRACRTGSTPRASRSAWPSTGTSARRRSPDRRPRSCPTCRAARAPSRRPSGGATPTDVDASSPIARRAAQRRWG